MADLEVAALYETFTLRAVHAQTSRLQAGHAIIAGSIGVPARALYAWAPKLRTRSVCPQARSQSITATAWPCVHADGGQNRTK
jgi:hypothetical protein